MAVEQVSSENQPATNKSMVSVAPGTADLSRMIPEEVLDRLVYFVGSTRSGTTIISRSFFMSDRVFTFPTFTQFTHNVWKHRNKVDARMLRRIFRMPKFYHELRVFKSLDDQTRARFEREVQGAFATKHFGRLFKIYPRHYALDPDCVKNGARALCWSDKANDIEGLFDIPRYMPQAKVVFVIRDPRATIASMQGQVVLSRGEQTALRARLAALLQSAIYWRNMMQAFLRFSDRYPDRVAFVSYEDFVDAPDKTINALLEFGAGERMPENTLSAGLARLKQGNKHEKSANSFGIDRRPLERWRRMLATNEIDIVTAMTWKTGRKLGYDIGPARLRPALAAILRIEGLRQKAILAIKLAYLEVREWLVPRRAGAPSRRAD